MCQWVLLFIKCLLNAPFHSDMDFDCLFIIFHALHKKTFVWSTSKKLFQILHDLVTNLHHRKFEDDFIKTKTFIFSKISSLKFLVLSSLWVLRPKSLQFHRPWMPMVYLSWLKDISHQMDNKLQHQIPKNQSKIFESFYEV